MRNYRLVVLTNANEGRDDEFNTWYSSVHIPDMLKVPGVLSAQRFQATTTQNPKRGASPYRYMALYEVSTPSVEQVLKEIAQRIGTPEMKMSDSMDPAMFAYYFEPMKA